MNIKNKFLLNVGLFFFGLLGTVGCNAQTMTVNSLAYVGGPTIVETAGTAPPPSRCTGFVRYTQLLSTPGPVEWYCINGIMMSENTIPAGSPGQFLTYLNNGQIGPQTLLLSNIAGILPIASGGNGTATPGLLAGSNIAITGSWPNQTITGTGGTGGTGTVSTGNIYALSEYTANGTIIGPSSITTNSTSSVLNVPGSINASSGNITSTGTGAISANITTKCLGFGYSYGNDGSSAQGWSGCRGVLANFYSASNGIQQVFGYKNTNDNLGDGMGFYGYSQYFANGFAASNEGVGSMTLQSDQIGFYSGTLIAPTAGGLIQPYNSNLGGNSVITFANNSPTFNASGPIATLSAIWNPGFTPTAQTGYFFLATLNDPAVNTIGTTANSYTITAIIPVSVSATTGTQTWTAGTGFTATAATAGQYLGFYIATGYQPASSSVFAQCLVGAPALGTFTFSDATTPTCSPVVIQATLASPTTGSQMLATNNFTCNGYCDARSGSNFAQGGIIFDKSQTILTASTTGKLTTVPGLAPYYTITTGSVPVSTAWGTIIASSCTNNSNGQSITPIATTCNVILGTSPASPGPFVPGQDVYLSRVNVQEESEVTAVGPVGAVTPGVQSVTFMTANAWNTTSYGPAAVMMQGGPGSVAVVPTDYISNWPMANMVLGAYTPTEIAVSTSEGQLIFPQYCGANTFTLASSLSWPNSTLVRSGNVVTLANWDKLPSCLTAGSSFTVSGATPSDLNGTFTVTYNSLDANNSYITWTQIGVDETATGSVTVTTPLTSLTLFPASYIVGNNGGISGTAQTSKNMATWALGDTVVGAPSPVYNQTGIWIIDGQDSPNAYSSYPLHITGGVSPYGGGTTDSIFIEGGATNAGIQINGSYPTYLNAGYRPENNGTVIEIGGGEPVSSNPKGYNIFEDNGNGGGFSGAITIGPAAGSLPAAFGFTLPITTSNIFLNGFEFSLTGNGLPTQGATCSLPEYVYTDSKYGLPAGFSLCNGTSWLNMMTFNSANNQVNIPTSLTIAGILPCLQNGNNCPSSAGVADVPITVSMTTVPANSCLPSNATFNTTTMAGLTSNMTLTFTWSTDYHNVIGFDPTQPGLKIVGYPLSGSFNWLVCNNTANPITPSQPTIWNVSAK